MPNQEVMREWVNRLRSGDYEQGRGKLSYTKQDDVRRHCCLGVLADIAAEQGASVAPVVVPEGLTHVEPNGTVTSNFVDVYVYEGGSSVMPSDTIYAWADIPCGNPMLAGPKAPISANKLANMNDHGQTFDQIADYIEEQWIDLPEGTEIPDSPAAIETEDVNA